MAALVVHASKDGESTRTLFVSPVLALAKARGLFKTDGRSTSWTLRVAYFTLKSSTIFSGSLPSAQASKTAPGLCGRRVFLCAKTK
jgi:hypothetical protein